MAVACTEISSDIRGNYPVNVSAPARSEAPGPCPRDPCGSPPDPRSPSSLAADGGGLYAAAHGARGDSLWVVRDGPPLRQLPRRGVGCPGPRRPEAIRVLDPRRCQGRTQLDDDPEYTGDRTPSFGSLRC